MEREEIRERLSRNKLSFVWLINQLEKRGVMTDKTEMSGAISGSRKGPKVDLIIRESIAALDEYEANYADAANAQ